MVQFKAIKLMQAFNFITEGAHYGHTPKNIQDTSKQIIKSQHKHGTF